MRCLECGNKAKKDCLYLRCRSCCKGHGFQCETHIKSTWVPISTRQRNSVAAMGMAAPPAHHQLQQLPLSSEPSPSSAAGFGGHECFPAEMRGEALFTCVRVTNQENAYAYETTINIGGHVFRGILYDQGPLINHQINLPS